MPGYPKNPEVAYRRNRLGGVLRRYPPDHPKAVEARRDLDFVNLADHVAAVVAGWPPPSEEQLDHIAGLLRAGREAPT
jgi:hypothetical protein